MNPMDFETLGQIIPEMCPAIRIVEDGSRAYLMRSICRVGDRSSEFPGWPDPTYLNISSALPGLGDIVQERFVRGTKNTPDTVFMATAPKTCILWL
jgi:hypothetical protein